MFRHNLFREAEFLQGPSRHHAGRKTCKRDTDCLAYKGHCSRGPWIHLEDKDLTIPDGILDIHQAFHFQGHPEYLRLMYDLGHQAFAQGYWRQAAGRIATMHACFLDVFHDATNDNDLTVTYGVHIHLDRILHETIDKHRMFRGSRYGLRHISVKTFPVVDDFHGPSAQDVGRPHDNRIPDPRCHLPRSLNGSRQSIGRLLQAKLVEELLKPLPVFRQIDLLR